MAVHSHYLPVIFLLLCSTITIAKAQCDATYSFQEFQSGGQSSLQVAINNLSLGRTICLGAGTYVLSGTLVIPNSIGLLGAQRSNPRQTLQVAETIFQWNRAASPIISLRAANSIVNGIAFISSRSITALNATADSTTVSNCLFLGINGEANAMTAVNVAGRNFGFYNNYLQDISQILAVSNADNLQFSSNNAVRINSRDPAAIYLSSSSNAVIRDSKFEFFDGNPVLYSVASENLSLINCQFTQFSDMTAAIVIGAVGGSDVDFESSTVLEGVQFLGSSQADGIHIFTSSVTIFSSEFRGLSYDYGALYVGFSPSDINITESNFAQNTRTGTTQLRGSQAVRVGIDSLNYVPTMVSITYSCIAGNSGGVRYVLPEYSGEDEENNVPTELMLNAPFNWWGNADGPGPFTPTGDTIFNPTHIQFQPWAEYPLPACGGSPYTSTPTTVSTTSQGPTSATTGAATSLTTTTNVVTTGVGTTGRISSPAGNGFFTTAAFLQDESSVNPFRSRSGLAPASIAAIVATIVLVIAIIIIVIWAILYNKARQAKTVYQQGDYYGE